MTVGHFLYVLGDYGVFLVLWILGVFGLILTMCYGVVITIADEVGISDYLGDKTTEIARKISPVLKDLGRSIKENILLLFLQMKEVIGSDRVIEYRRRIREILSRFVYRCIYLTAKWARVFSREIRYYFNALCNHVWLQEKMRSIKDCTKKIKKRGL